MRTAGVSHVNNLPTASWKELGDGGTRRNSPGLVLVHLLLLLLLHFAFMHLPSGPGSPAAWLWPADLLLFPAALLLPSIDGRGPAPLLLPCMAADSRPDDMSWGPAALVLPNGAPDRRVVPKQTQTRSDAHPSCSSKLLFFPSSLRLILTRRSPFASLSCSLSHALQVRRHFSGNLKPPFNVPARAAAGFDPSWYVFIASGRC